MRIQAQHCLVTLRRRVPIRPDSADAKIDARGTCHLETRSLLILTLVRTENHTRELGSCGKV